MAQGIDSINSKSFPNKRNQYIYSDIKQEMEENKDSSVVLRNENTLPPFHKALPHMNASMNKGNLTLTLNFISFWTL